MPPLEGKSMSNMRGAGDGLIDNRAGFGSADDHRVQIRGRTDLKFRRAAGSGRTRRQVVRPVREVDSVRSPRALGVLLAAWIAERRVT